METVKKEKLKIGILIDDFLVPAWCFSLIEKLNESYYAEIVLVVKKEAIQSKKQSLASKIWSNFHQLLYILFRKLEDKIFRPTPFAFEKKDLSILIKNLPVLEVVPVQGKFSDTIIDVDIENISQYNIDVFIRLGFRILKGDILRSAKYGVWSYHHGDNLVNRGGPAGVWESIEGWRETGCILQVLTEDLDAGNVLHRSWSHKELISINRSINTVYWKATSFIPRKLEAIYKHGEAAFKKDIADNKKAISFYSNRLYTTPTNTEFISRLIKQYLKWLRIKCWYLFNFEQWILLYHLDKKEHIGDSIFRYKRITPPKDRFWADPCLIYNNNKYYIFFEELIYKQNSSKAHIAVIEMDEQGNYWQPEIVLKRDHHLSYPFVFNYKGIFYMIPETMEISVIQLYKCIDFPNKWEFVMNLKENVKAVDTTIFEKDGKLWMFTNIKENPGASSYDELFLFYADELLTNQWLPHPLNPIVSDIKSARPAGALFYNEGKLYRPSQDCSVRYGYATVINEVVEMSTTEYIEKSVTNILPNWSKDVVATHALSHQHKLTVIDALIKRIK